MTETSTFGRDVQPGVVELPGVTVNPSMKKLTAVAVAGGVVAMGGAAWALWPASGAGAGKSQALTAVSITVTAATGAADLYPGFTGGNVFFTVSNPNPYPVTFTSMTPGTITSSDPTGCPASNVTVAAAPTISLAVPAQASNVASSLPGVVTMDLAAPTGCQGAVFTIGLSLTGTQT